MSLAQRFERRLEGVVGSAFARVFKGQVEPVEIGNALQREASDKHAVMGSGAVLAPNRYRVSLSETDYERLSPWDVQLCNSLAELVQEFLDEQRWSTVGDVEVILHLDESLHTGVFGVASRMEPAAPPRQRPFDSLSLPAVPGSMPGQYEAPYAAGPSEPESLAAAPSFEPAPVTGAEPAPEPALAGGDGIGRPNDLAAPEFAPPPARDPWSPVGGQALPVSPPPYVAPRAASRIRGVLAIDGSPTHLVLRRGSNVIGRSHDADLQILDQGVSRRHVDVQFDGEAATAYDLGSTNGTSVNGHQIGSHQLQHGDVLRVGHTRIVYHQENG